MPQATVQEELESGFQSLPWPDPGSGGDFFTYCWVEKDPCLAPFQNHVGAKCKQQFPLIAEM